MPQVVTEFEAYAAQEAQWPKSGQHIMAQWTQESIVVYQAFNKAIAEAAVTNQLFGGGGYSTSRMTWIKTNFLWMMYRCGWAAKDANQARVLAIELDREAFEELLIQSWPSSYNSMARLLYASREAWQADKRERGTVLQWDPDHTPDGQAHPGRRAMQIGIRSEMVQSLFNTRNCIRAIEDITEYVISQRQRLEAGQELLLPRETVYVPLRLQQVSERLQLDPTKVEPSGLAETAVTEGRKGTHGDGTPEG